MIQGTVDYSNTGFHKVQSTAPPSWGLEGSTGLVKKKGKEGSVPEGQHNQSKIILVLRI